MAAPTGGEPLTSEVDRAIKKDLQGWRWPGARGLIVQMERTRTGGEAVIGRGSIGKSQSLQGAQAVCWNHTVLAAQAFGLGLLRRS